MIAAPAGAWAQTGAATPGFYFEAEGQRVFGASDFDAGLAPDLSLLTLHTLTRDEGDGFGGALVLGYAWGNAWRASLGYRRLEAATGGGPMEPYVIAFVPSIDLADGGIPFDLFDVLTRVESRTSLVDLLAGTQIAVAAGRLEVFGGLSYARVDRDITLVDCDCSGLAVHYGSTFDGVGPKLGFRGGFPIGGGVQLVGRGSVAVLFGQSEFRNSLSQPDGFGLPVVPVTDKDGRTVGAFDAEAGLAFGIGAGTLTVGYRVDAWLGALDSDQRVSADLRDLGMPAIGDKRDDLVEHGPFVRFAAPLAGVSD
ncbi:MAG: Lpg1974 family pore-forming outer membrane protein [Hyphomicrobium sp.]|uniref:Lpg1974 family pore-forming outer membrane protein n=1 Tax=Hyphomicrobium sp. TaxID=82 RepID=UPI003D0CF897